MQAIGSAMVAKIGNCRLDCWGDSAQIVVWLQRSRTEPKCRNTNTTTSTTNVFASVDHAYQPCAAYTSSAISITTRVEVSEGRIATLSFNRHGATIECHVSSANEGKMFAAELCDSVAFAKFVANVIKACKATHKRINDRYQRDWHAGISY